MIQLLHDIKFDWLGNRRIFIAISIVFMLTGLSSAVIRQLTPGGTDAFNLGVDFKGGTVLTVKFKKPPTADALRSAMNKAGIAEPIIQPSVDKPDEFLIKLALEQSAATPNPPAETKPETTNKGQDQNPAAATKTQVNPAAIKAKQALDSFGKEAQTKH